jgi:hypothetical protein
MSNQRDTFAKRRREQERKDKARAKQERLAARRSETRTTKGPEIAWDEQAPAVPAGDDVSAGAPLPPPSPGDGPSDGS